MASEWHYSKNGTSFGPESSQRLKELAASGELGPDDLVWKEGMREWARASTLKGLFLEAAAKPTGPPPLPPMSTPNSPSAPPPMADGATTTTARKPDFFDRAREIAQRATETVGQAKAKAEVYQREVQEKYAKTVAKAQERLDRPAAPAPDGTTSTSATRPVNPQPTGPGVRAAMPSGESDEVVGRTQTGADQAKDGPGAADFAQHSSHESILDSIFGWILLAFHRWKEMLKPTDPSTIQDLPFRKLFWSSDRQKYYDLLDEVRAYSKVCSTRASFSHKARQFMSNEVQYWAALTDDQQTVGEVLELHRRAKLVYDGVEPLPDPRPVDHFKLELLNHERDRQAEAAQEAAKFENMREAVYRGNQEHAETERNMARFRRFMTGK
jgi:hypothetical protein